MQLLLNEVYFQLHTLTARLSSHGVAASAEMPFIELENIENEVVTTKQPARRTKGSAKHCRTIYITKYRVIEDKDSMGWKDLSSWQTWMMKVPCS